jgi:hypothetical protein
VSRSKVEKLDDPESSLARRVVIVAASRTPTLRTAARLNADPPADFASTEWLEM